VLASSSSLKTEMTLIGLNVASLRRLYCRDSAIRPHFYTCISPCSPRDFLLYIMYFAATLIFIGWDLLYEWLWEVREKLMMTEYLVLLATFIAIHIIGIDAGILFGVVVAIIDHVITTAQVTSVTRVIKRSRAVWTPGESNQFFVRQKEWMNSASVTGHDILVQTHSSSLHFSTSSPAEDWKLLQDNAYGNVAKIVTFEVKGSVFFGNSTQLLTNICEDVGLDATQEETQELTMTSPAHRGYPRLAKNQSFTGRVQPNIRRRPDCIVLDLSHLNNLDASAAQGCFLQLAKMCAKRGIVVCATGALPRVEWMMRSHDVAYTTEEEEEVKQSLLDAESEVEETKKILLFLTVYEGLEFCENLMIQKLTQKITSRQPSFVRLDELIGPADDVGGGVPKETLPHVFSHILGLHDSELSKLSVLERQEFHEEVIFNEGVVIFRRDTDADAFFIVLKGAVALVREDYIKPNRQHSKIISGAGQVQMSQSPLRNAKEIGGDIRAILSVGTIFGFVDFLLERPRTFGVFASQEGTILAKISHKRMEQLEATNPDVHRIFQSVLLQSSVMELANCTCSE
jgi:CRP-like cAMP-binding protein/anti-anti-sigma regulatory factor